MDEYVRGRSTPADAAVLKSDLFCDRKETIAKEKGVEMESIIGTPRRDIDSFMGRSDVWFDRFKLGAELISLDYSPTILDPADGV